MHLKYLEIKRLRNLTSVSLNPGAQFNLFYGMNGSGKTTLLEAIYYLTRGKSFRTHLSVRLIQHQAEQFSLFAKIERDDLSILPIGIERYRSGESRIRVANENTKSIIEITKALPLLLLNPDSRSLLTASSKQRRQFIDWGVFHVEPSFFSHWQHAQRALKQRNAALKLKSTKTLVQLWDEELVIAAEILHKMRKCYINQLVSIVANIINELFAEIPPLTISYYSGWHEAEGLRSLLAQSFEKDLQMGYTQYGPHRADLIIRSNKFPAQDVLSQGQQKLIVYALHLAQGILLEQQTGKSCLYLLDELAAELDSDKRQRLIKVLHDIQAQVFVTGVNKDLENELMAVGTVKAFHVERGCIAAE